MWFLFVCSFMLDLFLLQSYNGIFYVLEVLYERNCFTEGVSQDETTVFTKNNKIIFIKVWQKVSLFIPGQNDISDSLWSTLYNFWYKKRVFLKYQYSTWINIKDLSRILDIQVYISNLSNSLASNLFCWWCIFLSSSLKCE